jgi:hypothetical protein
MLGGEEKKNRHGNGREEAAATLKAWWLIRCSSVSNIFLLLCIYVCFSSFSFLYVKTSRTVGLTGFFFYFFFLLYLSCVFLIFLFAVFFLLLSLRFSPPFISVPSSLFCFPFLESWRWDELRWQVLKLLRSANGCCFWGQRNR